MNDTDVTVVFIHRAKDSMYHALGYSTILVMQAAMTFEPQDIQMGIGTMKEALQTCQRFRKRNSVVESLSNLVSKQTGDQLSEGNNDENMINFIKGGLKIRTSYQIYKECHQVLASMTKNKCSNDTQHQFEGGVKLGIGAFNLMLSLLPSRILRLLEFIGFSGNRNLGLLQLREGASGSSLRAILCVLTLLFYHTYVSLILGKAQDTFRQCIVAQQEWKQIHHLCYWELMWSHSFQQDWLKAYHYADLLCKESKWSKATYVFQKAAILSMLPEEAVRSTGEDIVALFRQVEGLKQRIAGKSIPTEKFAVRKSRRYSTSSNPVKLVLPALEMMYVWNGFTIVGRRSDLTESLLVTIEKAETDLQNEKTLLPGLPVNHPLWGKGPSEKRLKYDHYLLPFTHYELGLLYKEQGDKDKAIRFIETAKNNYKDYSMESRLHFRIHAALSSLKGTPPSTPP
ncbi:hypothetical protein GDO78_006859 [Eleutherodactylus coqui]|uniref:Tetratricopeptide repeat protein 39B n=1 Tax=Eleutherodactylus coqui TaxID=57060 RepID=A0A8J6FEF3_ELECQ|nr:hypothetical protein GDO78_006859 [Eleutherodactylus coqui]